MIPLSGRCRRPALTLVELLVVVAILATLSGIIYAASGGVRERARQTVCISNLHQIGLAIAMYRQDYGGTDTPGWPSEMGFPTSFWGLNKMKRPGATGYLAASDDIFFCPDFPRAEHPESGGSYGWVPWEPASMQSIRDLPSFPDEVARRGQDTPVMYCSHHNFPAPDRPEKSRFVIVLRLDGRVTRTWSPTVDSWDY